MQETIKRVASGALGLLMGGATLMMPAMATADLASFADMKPSDTLIVVGANAITQDVVGAINIGGALAQHGATATVTGSLSTGAVTGGVGLATTNTKVYMGDTLRKAKQTLTKDDLSVLASGSVKDNSGTAYTYDQYVAIGDAAKTTPKVSFGTSGNDLTSAQGLIELSTQNTEPLYTARVVFNKDLDVNSTQKTAGKTLNLFGKEYTIATDPAVLSETNLVLYGGGDEITVIPGETSTVTIDGTEHTVEVLGVGAGTATLRIDGNAQDVATNDYVNVGTTSVFVKAIHAYTVPKDSGDVVLRLGSDKLTLKNSDYVRTGTNDDAVKGTWVTLTAGGADLISQIDIKVYAEDSTSDYISSGSSLTDPVFKSFKVSFGGYEPSLTSTTSRDTLTLSSSGDNLATLTLTDYKGVSKTLNIASNYFSSTAQSYAKLQDQNDYVYNVLENASASLNHYVTINTNDFSHVLQVTNFDVGAAVTTKTVTLRDMFSNTDYKVNLALVTGDQYAGNKVIDGYTYTFNVPDVTSATPVVQVGDSSSGLTVFPTIKTRKGADVALLSGVTLVNNTAYLFPTQTAPTTVITDAASNVTVEGIIYHVAATSGVVDEVYIGTTTVELDGAATTGPAVLVIEEKDSASTRNVILAPITVSATPYKVEVDSGALTFSDSTAILNQKTEDTKVTKNLDLYGTLMTKNTDGQGTITISYPDEQAVANIYVLEASAAIPAAGEVSAGSATINQPSLNGGLAKVDSAVTSADKTEKNLILVGGPAANALVAELAAANKTHSMDTWMADLVGKYVIQAVEDAFATGKTAIVVAGYDYAQTQAASLKIATEALSGEEVTSA